jgi:uncharacterized protein (UPF0179 family)
LITLIGKKLAKPGQEFIHFGVGNSRECMGCKLRKVCDNLQVGRRYVVQSSMNKPHEKCKIHEEGVMLVEVEPAEIRTVVPADASKDGNEVVFIHPDCSEYDCERRDLCFPEGIRDGDQCEIVKILEKKVDCPRGAKLTSVILRIREEEKHH